MLRILTTLLFSLSLAGGAWAQDKQTAQQERMKSCNAQAGKKELKGDERKAFMSKCLSAKGKDDKELTAQQQKMKSCNAQASKKEHEGRRAQGFHEQVPQGRQRRPDRAAGKDEDLQRAGEAQGAQGRAAPRFHERLPQDLGAALTRERR